ncbi:MAG: glycosyltransferase family 2 protein [Acidimicrobiales bacterium]|nr:glycosyltransferase family 2 protein [Acidimicrobiales bacterium]
MVRFSVVVATLVRGSYPALVASVRRQTLRSWELIARADAGNEYLARNRGAVQARGEVLVFVDDDATLRPSHLHRLVEDFESRPDLVAVSGPLQGDMFGSGNILLDHRGWWVGANMAVRRDVFLERPFEETWGLGRTPRGWRADSDLGFSIEERYPGRWLHDSELVVDHPGKMQSVWDPEVEALFFQRWRSRYIERFVPVDPRGQQFLLETQDLTADERAKVVSARRELRRNMPGLPVLPQEA